MPNPRTMVTELGTGLGLLGATTSTEVLATRPARDAQPVARGLGPTGPAARRRAAFDADFHAAWENGRAFLAAQRRPAGPSPGGGRVEGRHPGSAVTKWRRSTCGSTTST